MLLINIIDCIQDASKRADANNGYVWCVLWSIDENELTFVKWELMRNGMVLNDLWIDINDIIK